MKLPPMNLNVRKFEMRRGTKFGAASENLVALELLYSNFL